MTDKQATRIYGTWAGNMRGNAEDPTRCVESVYPPRDVIGHQCRRKRGYGKDGLYCRQHAKWHGGENVIR